MSTVRFALDLIDPRDGERLQILDARPDDGWHLICQQAQGEGERVFVSVGALPELGGPWRFERRK